MAHALAEATLLDELLSTEYAYLSHLDATVAFYKQPFPLAVEVPVVFANVEALRDLHETLSTELGTVTELAMVADVFLRFTPMLRIYLPYCGNFHRAVQRLRELDPELAPFLAAQKSASNLGVYDLRALLKEPTLRLSRYVHLLRGMATTSSDASAQRQLACALAELEKLVGQMNEAEKEPKVSDEGLR
jgi:hypothetical protein